MRLGHPKYHLAIFMAYLGLFTECVPANADAYAQTILESQGFKALGSAPLRGGALSIFELRREQLSAESPNTSSDNAASSEIKKGAPYLPKLAILFDVKGPLTCTTDLIDGPPRLAISCVGKILQSRAPLVLPTSKIAKRVRFGSTPESSKFVFDLLEPLPAFVRTEKVKQGTIFYLSVEEELVTPPLASSDAQLAGGLPVKSSATSISTVKAQVVHPVTPINSSTHSSNTTLPKTTKVTTPQDIPRIFTSVPLVHMTRGEVGLVSIMFAKSPGDGSPTLKIEFPKERKVSFRSSSPTTYELTVSGARISSPVFGVLHRASDDLKPFVSVLPKELHRPGSPINLVFQIVTSWPVLLGLRKQSGMVTIYVVP